jgi:uncharacterized phage-like protein YoqJ
MKWLCYWLNEKPFRFGKHMGETPTGHYIIADFSANPENPHDWRKVVIHAKKGAQITSFETLDDLLLFLQPHLKAAAVEQPTAPNVDVKPAVVVTVTGHRPDKLGGYKTPNPLYNLVIEELAKAFELFKPDYVITGMSLGVDQWAAELCLNMGIKFVAAVPFENQESKWPPHSQSRYHWLLNQASDRYTISPGGYEPWKMQARNEWMVKSCQHVIAVWNGSPGGTANCLQFAMSLNKPVYYCKLPPAGMDLSIKAPQQQTTFQGINPANKPAQQATPNQAKRLLDI